LVEAAEEVNLRNDPNEGACAPCKPVAGVSNLWPHPVSAI
jgi:hypothetical protein